MIRAYYAITSVGPYRQRQVVLLDDQDGMVRTGYLREIVKTQRPIVMRLRMPDASGS
jgi:hypothetical protein